MSDASIEFTRQELQLLLQSVLCLQVKRKRAFLNVQVKEGKTAAQIIAMSKEEPFLLELRPLMDKITDKLTTV